MSDSSSDEVVKSVVKAGAEVVTEVAKAEQETQKTYQSALELVRRAGAFLNGVFGPASQELGLLFGDQMRFWRFKNAVKILEKTQALVEQRGLRPEQIRPLGFGEGLLLLEAASLEEDDTVQDMWARLMANAVDSERGTKPEKVYVDLLKSITGREAALLDLVEQIEERGRGFRDAAAVDAFARDISTLAESKWRKFSTDDRAICIQNLVRLRCLAVRPTPIDVSNLFVQIPRGTGGQSIAPFAGTQWALIDPQKFQKVLQEIVDRQMTSSGMVDFKHRNLMLPYANVFFPRGGYKLDLPEANFMLTPLGRGLMRACKLPQQEEGA